jgi:hypothetical protein
MENCPPNKSTTNMIIDLIMFILMMMIAGIGLLIKYVIGHCMRQSIDTGSGSGTFFWGLSRHQWGTIHLIVGIVFLILLCIHIILHWKTIVCIFKRMIPKRTLRIIIVSLIIAIGILMISFPLFVKPVGGDNDSLHPNRYRRCGRLSQLDPSNNMDRFKNKNTFYQVEN